METQTLATALSTLSLNIIDSDSVPTTGIVESTRRGSSSRVTRTYSNCSYTLVNTFRHTAECRATTLPAVRVKRPAGVCPDSTTTMPRAPLLPNSFRRLASGTPRNSPRPLGVRVQAACSRDNNVYEIWHGQPEQALMQVPRTLKCRGHTSRSISHKAMLQIEGQLSAQFATTENADTSCDEQHTTKAPMQAGSQFSCKTQATIEHISPSHPVIDHDDRDMCNVRHKQPSIQIGGNCKNYIRLHPPVGHKVASYV
ncbi:hypothetical protein EMCRGX_G020122 [Ephydatia muelleri]